MRKQKRKFIFTLFSFILISSFLVLTTFERNKTGFSVFGKTFFAGTGSETFDVDLFWTANPDNGWNNVETAGNEIAFGSNILWEPDHTELRYFKVQNAGDYDFNYNLGIDLPSTELDTLEYVANHPIGDVIDVYVCNDINNLSSKTYLGTLNELLQSPNIVSNIPLASGGSKTCALEFTMKHSAGNEYQGVYDQNNNRTNNIGFKIYAGAYADEPEPETGLGFDTKLTDDCLYRVGNGNNITASKLFEANNTPASNVNNPLFITASAADIDYSLISFTSTRIAGSNNVGFTFTPGTGTYTDGDSFLAASTFRFAGTGVVKVKMMYNQQPATKINGDPVELNLEVVNGRNVTASDTTFGNSNVALIEDITSTSRFTLSNGNTIYGNGHSITSIINSSNQTQTRGNQGFLHINNGTIDNVQVKGYSYPEAQILYGGGQNDWYAPCISVASGGAYIYNSLVEECRVAVKSSGELYAENSMFAGGTNGNIEVASSITTLRDCITTTSLSGGLKGLGVIISSINGKIKLEGTFKQYNWVKKADIPSDYQTALSDVFNDTTYAKTVSGTKYLNGGIFCFNPDVSFEESVARTLISDGTSNVSIYGYKTKTLAGKTATAYTQKAASATESDVAGISSYTPLGQYPTVPAHSFDFTNKNYIANDGGDLYCYYDQGKVNISFSTADNYFEWDPMILTATKYGSTLGYTVSMNNTDYTNGKIHFTQSGDYEVVYTINDTYYYGKDASLGSKTYTYTVNITVTAVDPQVMIYHPEFTYGTNGSAYGTASRQVTANNLTFVMPDISATGSNYGSTTVGGQTIYYPIISLSTLSSSGGSYSSGETYTFAPAFKVIKIVDKNKDTGATLYTYSSSSSQWPHGKGATNGPDSTYYGWGSTHPWERSSGDSGRSYSNTSSQGGLCFKSGGFGRNVTAGNSLVQFHYLANDGITYYYYICYSFTGQPEYNSCIAEGTQITLADGTQKPIEKVTYEDKLLTYNFFTGKTEAKDIAILVNHGKRNYEVLNLVFKDGTVLRFIGDHGVFDYTLNKYVYPTADNYKDYIGHKFVRFKENGKYKKIKLVDAFVTNEYTTAYSITSAQNSNAIAENMLTVAPPDKFYNWIDMGRKMRYDKKQFDADVEKYGTYDYSVFEDYVSYEIYQAFNGPYLKVAVEKGKFTFDDIINLIELYGSYMQ
ncbi:MAG: hypothetical protein IK085_00430 [Clostridia bacterium]|nr:hypothetical protein [Clostridia bacterium]